MREPAPNAVDAPRITISRTALACAVGNDSAAACAAIRAGVNISVDTRFRDRGLEWVRAARIHGATGTTGTRWLAAMLAPVILDCVEGLDAAEISDTALLLCVSESDRAGRSGNLEVELPLRLREACGLTFSSKHSRVVAKGKIGGAFALAHARTLLANGSVTRVLIAAVDSLIERNALRCYEEEERLLTTGNSNGFVPGEAASAVLVTVGGGESEVQCRGIGFAQEPATLASGIPLRGNGLARAVQAALRQAGCTMADIGFRISDISGEHYYFRETSLAVSRLLREPRDEFPIWHPAQSIGEVGAAVGPALFVVAHAAFSKGYAPSPRTVLQFSNGDVERAAVVLEYTGA